MHVTIINGKKGHKFERRQGEAYGRVWVEEREGKNDVIIISKDKSSNNKTCKAFDQHYEATWKVFEALRGSEAISLLSTWKQF